MPGETFNVLNDESAPTAQPPAPPAPSTQPSKSIFGAPGGGHMFEDGFSIPTALSRSKEEAAMLDPNDEVPVRFDSGEPSVPSKIDQPSGMPKGSPAVQGFDGSMSKTPADVMGDPDYEAIPEATPDTFICILGPCEHYLELQMGVDKPKDVVVDRPELWRVCRLMHDDEGEVSLKDANVPLCSAYNPPWWHLQAQAKKLEVRRRLARINKLKPPAHIRMLGRVTKAAGHVQAAADALRGKETD